MTPQDIREKTFEKAMFGGYDMAAVQNYQEEVATELANAQKEVAVLKGKMKVLVDKIEEYRASEDAMRLAILSAQKVGKQIEDRADVLETLRIFQKFDNFGNLLLGFVAARDVGESDSVLVWRKQARAAFAERHRALARAAHLAHEKEIQKAHAQARPPARRPSP